MNTKSEFEILFLKFYTQLQFYIKYITNYNLWLGMSPSNHFFNHTDILYLAQYTLRHTNTVYVPHLAQKKIQSFIICDVHGI